MTVRALALTSSLLIAPVMLEGQQQSGRSATQAPVQAVAQEQPRDATKGRGGLDPASIGQPLADSWPGYSGDYTGRRFSALTQVNQSTVKGLTLAWTARVTGGPPAAPGGFGAFGGFGGRGGGGPV